jgi:hypothetical protein
VRSLWDSRNGSRSIGRRSVQHPNGDGRVVVKVRRSPSADGGRPTIRCLALIATAFALGRAHTPLRPRDRSPLALLSRVDTGKTGNLASRTGHLAAHQRCRLTTRIAPHLANPTSITRLGCTGDRCPGRSRRRHRPESRRVGRGEEKVWAPLVR